jgi:CRP/FNR family cyclic AMP-dependent transcriptional regulator
MDERAIKALRRVVFFASLGPDVLDLLVRRARTAGYRRGARVLEAGSDGLAMLVLLSGEMKICRSSADGREFVLGFIEAGDVVGELSALDGAPRSADVVATTDAEALVLYRQDLLPALLDHPAAMLEIIRALCGKLRAAAAAVEENSLPMQGRAAMGLLRLSERHGAPSPLGTQIRLALSQRDLGAYCGLSRESLNRQLAALRAAGAILVEDRRITILDEDRLRQLALDG